MHPLAPLSALLLIACTQAPAEPAPQPPQTTKPTTGLDPAGVRETLATAARLPRLRTLLVLRDGREVVAQRFTGPPLDQPVSVKSASKTVLSALAGIAIQRGVLTGTDQTVASVLRADMPANPDPRLLRITVGNLLSMQSGLERTSGEYYGRWVASPNWVRFALSRPFVAEPGGAMLYSTGNSHILSAMLTRASGRSTHALAQDWLAAPLGIGIPPWPRDAQGIYFGGNDMLMSPRSLAAFGELYRNDGVARGRRILPAGWVAQSWRPRTTSPWSGNPYGYGWFSTTARGHPVHFAWGYGGQMVYVVPDLALTVVMTSDPSPHPRAESHVPALNALLADGIIPAAETGAS
ncbi:serine hydrolase domain-containing protein [Sphingomonas arantia]|uniref:Serine hydrolase domain-containing protein n=1 Tax=Sphingomonas arantia TaxID=1460676 RepID=A0ABW4U395_9SPHN